MAAEYLLELYYPVGVLLEFKPESCEERTGGVSRRSVGKRGDLDLYAGGTNYIWNSDISGKCHAPAGVVEAVTWNTSHRYWGSLEMQCCSFLQEMLMSGIGERRHFAWEKSPRAGIRDGSVHF